MEHNQPRNTATTITIALEAVIVAVTREIPRILTLSDTGSADALPFGPLDPTRHPTLEKALRDWVRGQTGIELGYAEQLYTFGDLLRGPCTENPHTRLISVAYLALTAEHDPGDGAAWQDWYRFLPWEDWREGRPEIIIAAIAPALNAWARKRAISSARERADIAFGLNGAPWDPERVLERYELLFEAGLVREARNIRRPSSGEAPEPGRPMVMDHRRIIATALGRLRGKIKYRPVIFELLPACFTLLQIQRIVEALSGIRLHKQNFRRLIERDGLVEDTGRVAVDTGGRPAKLFSFRHEVLRERPAPGVGLPSVLKAGKL
jgi:hypothetical protein